MASECACLLCVVVKNWSSKRCWHVSKQLSFLFEVSATINCLRHIGPFRKHPQFLEPLQPELKSTSKAPPPRAIPERTPHFRGITLRSHQQSNFPDITRKPSVTTAEISACDHAASSLPRWRRVRCMHSRWTVTKFLAISNHHATITTVTTNSHMKNYAATQISRMPHLPQGLQFSSNRLSSPGGEGDLRPSTKTLGFLSDLN